MSLIDLIAKQAQPVQNIFDSYRKGQVEAQKDILFDQTRQMNEMKLQSAQDDMRLKQMAQEYQQKLSQEKDPIKRRQIQTEMADVGLHKQVLQHQQAMAAMNKVEYEQTGRDNDELLTLKSQLDMARKPDQREQIYQKIVSRGKEMGRIGEAPASYMEAKKSGWLKQNIANLRASDMAWNRAMKERPYEEMTAYQRAMLSEQRRRTDLLIQKAKGTAGVDKDALTKGQRYEKVNKYTAENIKSEVTYAATQGKLDFSPERKQWPTITQDYNRAYREAQNDSHDEATAKKIAWAMVVNGMRAKTSFGNDYHAYKSTSFKRNSLIKSSKKHEVMDRSFAFMRQFAIGNPYEYKGKTYIRYMDYLNQEKFPSGKYRFVPKEKIKIVDKALSKYLKEGF